MDFLFFPKRLRLKLRAIFSFISTIVQDDELIEVRYENRIFYYTYVFPLYFGDMPRFVGVNLKSTKPTFCISFEEKVSLDTSRWRALFKSKTVSVYELVERSRRWIPIRFGLTHEERDFLLFEAKRTLTHFLAMKENISENSTDANFKKIKSDRLQQSADICVSLWCEGEIRGSQIITGGEVLSSVKKAITLACRDPRFAPLIYSDLSRITTQITIFSPLRIPFLVEELHKLDILHEKGYAITNKKKTGYYLPEIFNIRKYKWHKDFLFDLVIEKLGVPKIKENQAVELFEVDDFFMGVNSETSTQLMSSMRKSKENIDFFDEGRRVVQTMEDFLFRSQYSNGSIPVITGFNVLQNNPVDWVRLTFTLYALSYGNGDQKEVEDKKKQGILLGYNYVRHFILNESQEVSFHLLATTYFCFLAKSLGNKDDYVRGVKIIFKALPVYPPDIITYLHILSLLTGDLNEGGDEVVISRLAKEIKEIFFQERSNGGEMSLALWAEAVQSFRELDKNFSREVLEWILSYQKDDGSFPISTLSMSSNTRVTGKIFEVLALYYISYEAQYRRTFSWLWSMQYNGSEYFLKPEKAEQFKGGFRHDYGNGDIWIDSSAHVLIGLKRVFK